MSDPIKRLHYYDQQFLRSADFTADQNYHISMRRLHNQVLHTWGVAQGLALALAGTAVTVAPGVAVDSQGREMVVGAAINLDLSTMAVNTTQYVTIAYGEQTSDHSTESGGAGDTRWTEQPNVSLVAALPADPSLTLVLGQITKAQDSSFSLNTSGRIPAAAITPPDITATSLALRNSAVQTQWPRFTSAAANQAALNGNLAVTGDVGGNNVVAVANLSAAAANVTGTVTCDHLVQNNPAADLAVKNSVKVGSPAVFGSAGSISASGDISGNNVTAANSLTVGPVSFGTNPGTVTVTGQGAQLVFARRNCATAPATLAAGDVYSWHNDTGVAQLWTPVNNQLLSVTSDGKLGIGTAAPSQKLDVQGSVNVQGSINAATNVSTQNYLGVGPVDFAWKNPGTIFASGAGAEIDFARRNLSSWPASPAAGDRYTWLSRDGSYAELFTDVNSTLLAVTKDGKVGIGTATPSQKLDVQGSINASGDVICNRFYTGPMGSPEGTGSIFASGTWAELGFARRNLTTWPGSPVAGDRYLWVNSDGSRATLWTDVAGDLLSVTKDGKVGLGTTTPSQKLDVQGSISTSGDVLATGNQNLVDVFVQLMAVQNNGQGNPCAWTCSHAKRFSKIYARFVVFQGFSIFGGNNNTSFTNGGHSVDANAIPQHVFVRLDDSNTSTEQTTGKGYCSESNISNEGDNAVLFTVVVIGKPLSTV